MTGENSPRDRWSLPVETGAAFVLVAVMLWMAFAFPAFRTWDNVAVVLRDISAVGIITAGMTLVIATGGIDISVGSVAGFCGVVIGVLSVNRHWPAILACGVGAAAGGCCGLVNGLLVARLGLPSIVATLATFGAARAGAYVLSGSESISGLPDWLTSSYYNTLLRVPIPCWVALASLGMAAAILRRTTFGRGLLALGGGRAAAYLSGIRTRRLELSVYALSGLFAGVSAIVATARAATAVPDAGKYMELAAITAVVMGGTPIAGGRATVIGTLLGVLTIGVVTNAVRSYGKEDVWANLVLGLVLLASVEVERWRARRTSS